MRLNLGCCDSHIDGFVNVDLVQPADVLTDLGRVWPWDDGTVDEIRANDIFEHLPDKIHTMNESWRVLKPGGLLSIRIPTTDGRGAFQDPTHRSFWTPNDLFYYVDGCPERKRFGRHYGISASFECVAVDHSEVGDKVWYLTAALRAVK
jgi:SAM-dependent methyltransferase